MGLSCWQYFSYIMVICLLMSGAYIPGIFHSWTINYWQTLSYESGVTVRVILFNWFSQEFSNFSYAVKSRSSSFMTCRRIVNISNTTDATSAAGMAYPYKKIFVGFEMFILHVFKFWVPYVNAQSSSYSNHKCNTYAEMLVEFYLT
jgi:hypothetical protein